MAKAVASNCPVCAGPLRQQIDSLLLLGWRADKIVQKLESATLTNEDIMAHRRRLHVRAHRPTLVAVAIGVMQELREEQRRIDAELAVDVPEQIGGWLTDPAKAVAEGKNPYAVEMAARSSAPYRKFRLHRYWVELQTKKLKVIETLHERICRNRNAAQHQINNETSQPAQKGSVSIDMMRAILERNGYEVTRPVDAPHTEHRGA